MLAKKNNKKNVLNGSLLKTLAKGAFNLDSPCNTMHLLHGCVCITAFSQLFANTAIS